ASPPPRVPPLGRAAGVAVRWNGAAALVTLISQLAQIFVLARGLTAPEFGLAAAALAVTAFLGGVSDLGLTNALLHQSSLSARSWASAWWAAAAGGLALCLLLGATAPILESLLHLPGLAALLAAAAL